MLGSKLKELRELRGFVQRQVAAEIEVDTAYISKIENEEKTLSRNQIPKLSKLYQIEENELQTLWLADKILRMLSQEVRKEEALKLVLKNLK